MGALRFYVRSLGLAAWMVLGVVGARLVGWLVRDRARRAPLRSRVFRFVARGSAWLLGMRIEQVGPAPPGPALLVSNHLSYLDILAYSAVVGPVFVSKHDVVELPLVGPLAQAMEAIFVDRGKRTEVGRVNDAMIEALQAGERVLLFPEGTTGDGAAVRPFHAALFKPSLRLDLPVHCAAIGYVAPEGAPPASESLAWHGGASLGRHARRMMRMPGYDVRIEFVAEPIASDRRKELALRCQEAVAGAFQPLAGAPTPQNE